MKEFKDLEFKTHGAHQRAMDKASSIYSAEEISNGDYGNTQAVLMFDNDWGVSVIRTFHSYGGQEGFYELAALDKDTNLTYLAPITGGDVIPRLTPNQITEVMLNIQRLPKFNYDKGLQKALEALTGDLDEII